MYTSNPEDTLHKCIHQSKLYTHLRIYLHLITYHIPEHTSISKYISSLEYTSRGYDTEVFTPAIIIHLTENRPPFIIYHSPDYTSSSSTTLTKRIRQVKSIHSAQSMPAARNIPPSPNISSDRLYPISNDTPSQYILPAQKIPYHRLYFCFSIPPV